jgi:hypothetical protein
LPSGSASRVAAGSAFIPALAADPGGGAAGGAGASGGAGTESRRGFGGGASRREDAPGGTESTRDGGTTGALDSTVMVSSMLEIEGALVRPGGRGGRPLDSAALDPGGGRLGVPTDTTR